MDWDAGPYFQSRFTDEHRNAAEKLIANGWAYKCFCTKEELEAKRQDAQKRKVTYQYDGTCRRRSSVQVRELEAYGTPYTIRLKVPEGDGSVVFKDVVYGEIEKKYRDIEDFVIVRANGNPLYVLSNTVDDIRDGITHIIRGQDGLANTPKQLLIYKALDVEPPVFAHMSLTLDPKKAKISKRRHGEQVAIHYYREKGLLPWAMVNFLVRLGWSTSDAREYFTREELIDAFDLKGINRTNSVFNLDNKDPRFFTDPKLLNTNAHYLRTMTIDTLLPHVKDQLHSHGMWNADYEGPLASWFRETVDLIRSRFHLLTDFTTLGRAYFSDDFQMETNAYDKYLKAASETVGHWMPVLADRLEGLADFSRQGLETMLRAFLSEFGLKPGLLVNAVRTAVTGQGVGPEFIDVLIVVGRERVVKRLRQVAVSLDV